MGKMAKWTFDIFKLSRLRQDLLLQASSHINSTNSLCKNNPRVHHLCGNKREQHIMAQVKTLSSIHPEVSLTWSGLLQWEQLTKCSNQEEQVGYTKSWWLLKRAVDWSAHIFTILCTRIHQTTSNNFQTMRTSHCIRIKLNISADLSTETLEILNSPVLVYVNKFSLTH